MSTISKIIALMGSDELDALVAPAKVLLKTIATYPAGRPLNTEAELEAFVVDDEAIRQSLARLVEQIAGLPIWDDKTPEHAELATDCRDGVDAWLGDLRRLVSLHPLYKVEMTAIAEQRAHASLGAASWPSLSVVPGAQGAAPSPSCAPVDGASLDAPRCMCGELATQKFEGFDICDKCAEGALEYAMQIIGGRR
jgi:hypothetical protein